MIAALQEVFGSYTEHRSSERLACSGAAAQLSTPLADAQWQ